MGYNDKILHVVMPETSQQCTFAAAVDSPNLDTSHRQKTINEIDVQSQIEHSVEIVPQRTKPFLSTITVSNSKMFNDGVSTESLTVMELVQLERIGQQSQTEVKIKTEYNYAPQQKIKVESQLAIGNSQQQLAISRTKYKMQFMTSQRRINILRVGPVWGLGRKYTLVRNSSTLSNVATFTVKEEPPNNLTVMTSTSTTLLQENQSFVNVETNHLQNKKIFIKKPQIGSSQPELPPSTSGPSNSGMTFSTIPVHVGQQLILTCNLCDRGFMRISALKKHVATHSLGRPFKCQSCAKTFVYAASLTRHTRTHSDPLPYECPTCKLKFSRPSFLKTHMRAHMRNETFDCNTCGRRYQKMSSLTQHQRVHLGIRPYQCEQCNKTFVHASGLHTHRKTHENLRPWSCDLCDKKFSRKYSMQQHKKIHYGRRPFVCELCNSFFSTVYNLKRHNATQHDNILLNIKQCHQN